MTTPLHILVLAEWFPHPGDPQLGIFIEKQAKAAALHHAISLIYVHGVKGQKKKYLLSVEGENPKIFRCSYRQGKGYGRNAWRYLRAFRKALRAAGGKKAFDLVHLQVSGRNARARKWHLKRKPYVLTEHWSGFLQPQAQRWPAGKLKTRSTWKNAAGISVVSEILKEAIEKLSGRKDIVVIPNVIEQHSVSTRPEKKPANPIRLLCVADLVDEIKNISGLLRALAQAEFSQPLQLSLIGDGPDRAMLETLAQDLFTAHPRVSVRFEGRKPNEEVLERLTQTDFLVVNSRRETFSMVAAEALLAGVPVIATRCGGPEQFVHTGNGILIPVNDTTALKNALEEMSLRYGNFPTESLKQEIAARFGKEKVGLLLDNFYRNALLPS